MITDNKYRVLRNNAVLKETIKSEASSLRVENTAEGLRASITAIESNKLEQETSNKGKNITPTDSKYWESGHYDTNGIKVPYATRIRLIDFIECESSLEYFTANQTYILRGYDKDKNYIQNIGVIHDNATFTTNENVCYLGVSIDKVYDEYNEETDQVMICKASESDKSWEKGYVDMPSTKYKSEFEGVTGDVNLVVHNKNLIGIGTLIKGFTDLQTGRFKIDNSSIAYYFETSKLPDEITISAINANRSNISFYNKIPDINVQSEIWNNANSTKIPRTISIDKQYKYVLIQFTYNQNATDIQVEEGIAVTDYTEPKKRNFTVSLEEKTLYKGDKIIRKEGKWYFAKHWKEFNREIFENDVNRVSQGFYFGANKLYNIKQASKIYSICQKEKNIVDSEWNTFSGNYIGQLYPNNHRGVYINYIAESKVEILEWYNSLSNKFIYELESEELEEIPESTLINQLDKILLNLYEYDDITNFNFDNDVTFEITVEKDKLSILENRLDNVEQNTTNAEMLALESEV